MNASEKSLDLQVVIVRSDDASQLLNVSHEPEGGTTKLSERIQLAYIPPFNSGKAFNNIHTNVIIKSSKDNECISKSVKFSSEY